MGDWRVITRERRDELGEGPLWVAAEGALYWVDILGQRLNRLTLADGKVTEWALPEPTGWVIARRDRPGFVAGMKSGIKALTLDPVNAAPLAELPDHPTDNRMNDAKADAAGRIWAGSMPMSGDRPTGNLYRLDTDRTVTRVDTGYYVANGPAIAPDGRTMLHSDSHLGEVYRFAINDDGSLGPRSLFVKFEPGWGSPDGMTFDAEGHLWIACWGASCVARFDAGGKRERAITLPAQQISSVAFAGEALDRMFVTSAAVGVEEAYAGALFEVESGARGLAPHTFAG